MIFQHLNRSSSRVVEAYFASLLIHSIVAVAGYWLLGFEIAVLALIVSGLALLAARAENRDELLVTLANAVETASSRPTK